MASGKNPTSTLRTRKDIRSLTVPEKDILIRAFDGIQKLKPTDPNSFFSIAGYHGEPFRGAGWGNSAWWGGFCNHGNVLFPTWHRAYLWRLEQALQSIPGCSSVSLPYWNELSDTTIKEGLPTIFLTKMYNFNYGGTQIRNPLYSYTFQAPVHDNLSPVPDADYSKPTGYTTVRYPFSGLVGPDDISTTNAHNQVMNDLGEYKTNQYLNDNIRRWLDSESFSNDKGTKIRAGEKKKYLESLEAPNYTVFSNTTSATQWNEDRFDQQGFKAVVPLESPHNGIHLAVGGYDIPGKDGQVGADFNGVPGANGDMGENDTAGFDPIFFFHHCFVDMMFWKWQQNHKVEIIPGYPGTNSVDSQGPTPGVPGGSWLTMNSPLDPFVKDGKPLTSQVSNLPLPTTLTPIKRNTYFHTYQQKNTPKDVVNIESLGYTYEMPKFPPHKSTEAPPHLRVSGVNRASIPGSFAISAWAFQSNSEAPLLVGIEPVLSRWHVSGCANCNNHLGVKSFVPLTGWSHEDADKAFFEVVVHTRESRRGTKAPGGRVPKLRLTPKSFN